jgi:hypothetical protein
MMKTRMLCVSAAVAAALSLQAAVPGDLAVYSNAGASDVLINAEGQAGSDVVNVFNSTVVAPPAGVYTRDAGNDGIVLDAGRHLVIYSTRVDHNAGTDRAEMNCYLTLDNGTETALACGRAQGFVRYTGGADEAVISGGAVVEAQAGDILRLHTARTDINSAKTVKILPGYTSIQVLKLDDGLDCLRLSRTNTVGAATGTAFVDVTYDCVDEASAGPMSFSAGSGDITFTIGGYYLVTGNTHIQFWNPGTDSRSGFTQRLTVNGAPLAGSYTTVYLRTSPGPKYEQCDDGAMVIGRLIKVVRGDVLRVEHKRESGSGGNIIGGKTALAVVKLPDAGAYIMLEDTTSQDLNKASATPVTFNTQAESPSRLSSPQHLGQQQPRGCRPGRQIPFHERLLGRRRRTGGPSGSLEPLVGQRNAPLLRRLFAVLPR